MSLLMPWKKNHYGKGSYNVKGKNTEKDLGSFFHLKQKKTKEKIKFYLHPTAIPTSTGSESL